MKISIVMINVVRGIASVKFETRVCNLVGRVQVASIWCDVITCAVPSAMINKCYCTHRDCEVSVLLEVEASELVSWYWISLDLVCRHTRFCAA